MPTIVETLAAYATSEQHRKLSDNVIHHAKRALIDWFASLLPGSELPPATLLIQALEEEMGQGRAVVFGSSLKASIRTAALINATASHTIEFDDIFRDAVYHPGCPIISAALAAAHANGADGEMLLRAIVIGYEISTRIGVAVQPSHYRFWHTTGTIGTFGAAASVAAIMGLDAAGHANALATAGTFAAGLQQAFRSDAMSKPLHAGHASEAGALAALAAAHGVTGALDVLEGKAGFGAAMCTAPTWDRATEALGERYNITQMTFKNHGCCGHCFATIDAVLALRPKLRIEDISRISVGTYKAAVEVTDRKTIVTSFDGRFSTPFTVASALVHGSVRLSGFTPERLQDPQVIALMQRVEMVIDPACELAFPGRRSSKVEIEMKDGTRLSYYQLTRKGDPDAALSDVELQDKFTELVAPVLGFEQAHALHATLSETERLSATDVLTLGISNQRLRASAT